MRLDRYQKLSPVAGETPDRGPGRAGGHVEPFEAVVADGDRALAPRCPDTAQDRLEADAMFVGSEGFDYRIGIRGLFRLDDVGEFF